MTSKLTHQTTDSGTHEKFPDFPPRDDMQNSLHLDDFAHQATLRNHFGSDNSIIVLSEIPVRQYPSQHRGHRIPDLLIAFGVNRTLAVEQKGYSISAQGKPPDFVLEIASETTGKQDYTDKRKDYAAFAIPEYWRFDPSGGKLHDLPLAGDRLVDGTYQPIEMVELRPDHLHGHSEALNLDLCWEDGKLRWWEPATQSYLMNFDEERDGRIAAEARANNESEARAAAEARVRELEAELRTRQQD